MAKKAKSQIGPKKRGADMPYDRRVVPVPSEDRTGAEARPEELQIEQRGIRALALPVTDDPRLLSDYARASEDHPRNRLEKMRSKAREILTAAQRRPLDEARRDFASKEGITDLRGRKADVVAEAWVQSVHNAYGNLTPEGIAASFLYWDDRMMRRSHRPEEETTWVSVQFADAWHWLHMEVYGEHRAAHDGVKRQEDLRAGPEKVAAEGQKRRSILEDEVRQFLAKRSLSGTPTTGAAQKAIASRVEERFKQEGFEPYKPDVLERRVREALRTVLRGND